MNQADCPPSLRDRFPDLQPLVPEASTRRYFRVAEGGESFVLCRYAEGSISPENDFIVLHDFLSRGDIRVPRILEVSHEEGWLLLEDAGGTDLGTAMVEEPSRAAEYRSRAMELLHEIQQLPLRPPVKTRLFDFDKLFAELVFLSNRLRDIGAYQDELQADFIYLCQSLGGALRTSTVFSHRDFHTRNIMVKDSQLILLDFQDARAGLPWYDLTSLLFDPYHDFSELDRGEMLRHFISLSGWEYDHELFFQSALQRILKALGTYLFQYSEFRRSDYKRSIPPTLERLTLILGELEGFHAVRELTARLLEREL